MQIEMIHMTPEKAAHMLANNHGNRTLRKSTVRSYAADMKAGQWRCTHQAIAIDANGNLLDGQHRLSAVIAAQWEGPMMLATYETTEETLKLQVDRGVRRTAYDILQKPRDYVECVSRLLKHTLITHGATPIHVIDKILQVHESKIERVHSICTSNKRLSGSAVSLAALLLTAYADRSDSQIEQSLEQYNLFFQQSYGGMWPHVQALNAWIVNGKKGTRSNHGCVAQLELFMRVYLAFDYNRRNNKVSRISNYDETKSEMGERAKMLIGDCVEE